MNAPRRQFASDNYSGICPEAWEGLARANSGHARSYGDDPWTQRAADKIREFFEADCEIFFVFNGTSANSLALAHLCRPFEAALCHEHAHIENDECGAPGFFGGGMKLIPMQGADGRLAADEVEAAAARRTDLHFTRVRAVSITQATEVGTVYPPEQVAAISAACKRGGLRLHMDGARLANALAHLKCAPAEATWRAGVEVLSFGGTKNGMAVGEAVVFFDRALARDFEFRAKQGGQLASKMRFVAGPWAAMIESGAVLRHAARANAMAERLAAAVAKVPQIRILFPREANAVFAQMPPAAIERLLAEGWMFYDITGGGSARLMCSWDTTEADVDEFAAAIRAACEAAG